MVQVHLTRQHSFAGEQGKCGLGFRVQLSQGKCGLGFRVRLQVSKASVVPLEKATTASCGAKAAACAELAKLADKMSDKQGSFGTAAGVCLPFGCMEAIIQVAYLSVHPCVVL